MSPEINVRDLVVERKNRGICRVPSLNAAPGERIGLRGVRSPAGEEGLQVLGEHALQHVFLGSPECIVPAAEVYSFPSSSTSADK